mmetsp:Transcript_35003/g.84498  ORF Transcript_35003/g.84498 Transcript_35003/m.84498 type:complete len:371 (-) Transcript_35003:184-1296(-)
MAGNDRSDNNHNDVQYFDSDFSFEEHAEEVQQWWNKSGGGDGAGGASDTATPVLTEDDDDLLPQSQSKFWDTFHSNHSAGNFYKPRRYLLKSFPCILQYFETGSRSSTATCDGGDQSQQKKEDRIVLEIGCGSGSSCIPLLKQCSDTECSGDAVKRVLLACDSSPIAVETTRRYIEKMTSKEDSDAMPRADMLFGAFVADPSLCVEESKVSFLQEVELAYEDLASTRPSDQGNNSVEGPTFGGGIAGIVLMVFVLSAVTPSRVSRFLEQVYQTTKNGGKVCFRDYGLYDMPMLRFDHAVACKPTNSNDDPVFIRGEGTIARFFSVETTRDLFESAGFTTVELRYCTVFNHNRKTGQKLKRVFVHGVFEKL